MGLIVVETDQGHRHFLGADDAISESSAGGSEGGHDPKAHGKIRFIVRAFGKWAEGKHEVCVRRIRTEHPEIVKGRNVNALCAWLKDQWAGTTKWRGRKSDPKQRAEGEAIMRRASATAPARFAHAMPVALDDGALDALVEDVRTLTGMEPRALLIELGGAPDDVAQLADDEVFEALYDAEVDATAALIAETELQLAHAWRTGQGHAAEALVEVWLALHGDPAPIDDDPASVADALSRIASGTGPLTMRSSTERRIAEALALPAAVEPDLPVVHPSPRSSPAKPASLMEAGAVAGDDPFGLDPEVLAEGFDALYGRAVGLLQEAELDTFERRRALAGATPNELARTVEQLDRGDAARAVRAPLPTWGQGVPALRRADDPRGPRRGRHRARRRAPGARRRRLGSAAGRASARVGLRPARRGRGRCRGAADPRQLPDRRRALRPRCRRRRGHRRVRGRRRRGPRGGLAGRPRLGLHDALGQARGLLLPRSRRRTHRALRARRVQGRLRLAPGRHATGRTPARARRLGPVVARPLVERAPAQRELDERRQAAGARPRDARPRRQGGRRARRRRDAQARPAAVGQRVQGGPRRADAPRSFGPGRRQRRAQDQGPGVADARRPLQRRRVDRAQAPAHQGAAHALRRAAALALRQARPHRPGQRRRRHRLQGHGRAHRQAAQGAQGRRQAQGQGPVEGEGRAPAAGRPALRAQPPARRARRSGRVGPEREDARRGRRPQLTAGEDDPRVAVLRRAGRPRVLEGPRCAQGREGPGAQRRREGSGEGASGRATRRAGVRRPSTTPMPSTTTRI